MAGDARSVSWQNADDITESGDIDQAPSIPLTLDTMTLEATDETQGIQDEDVVELPAIQPCLELVDAKTRHLFSYCEQAFLQFEHMLTNVIFSRRLCVSSYDSS